MLNVSALCQRGETPSEPRGALPRQGSGSFSAFISHKSSTTSPSRSSFSAKGLAGCSSVSFTKCSSLPWLMMSSTDARCKWKQVLGFDDGMPASGSVTVKLRSSEIFQMFQPQIKPSYPKLPEGVTFSRTDGGISISTSVPATSSDDGKPLPAAPPLLYLSLQHESRCQFSTGRPDMTLHSGPTKTSAMISFARFLPGHQDIDMTLCSSSRRHTTPRNFSRPSTSASSTSSLASSTSRSHVSSGSSVSSWSNMGTSQPRFQYERLVHTGGRFSADKHTFHHRATPSSPRERFEWRHASGLFSRCGDSGRNTSGLRLIRTSRNETVVVYAGLSDSSLEGDPERMIGMLRFLRSETSLDLGEDFEILAIMSILSVIEKGRRTMESRDDVFEVH